MTASGVATVAGGGPRLAPRYEAVLSEATTAVSTALEQMWPTGPVALGPVIPSVSTIVRYADTPSGGMVAKYWLSEPLPHLLRRASGRQPHTRSLGAGVSERVERQSRQLSALRRLGVRICGPTYTSGRVLVSRRVEGPSLGQLLVATPADAGSLLDRAWRAVEEIHRPYRIETDDCAALAETAGRIPDIYASLYRGAKAQQLLASLGMGWFGPVEQPQIRRQLSQLLHRIDRLSSGGEDLADAGESGLAFGQLEPDHVLFDRDSGCAVLCAPRLQLASSVADAAMLLSRTVITLLAGPPVTDTPSMCAGIAEFVQRIVATPRSTNPEERLRRLLVLWLMDTLTVTGTCLVTPPDVVALPPHLTAARRWVPPVLITAQTMADHLVRRRPAAALRHSLQKLADAAGHDVPLA